jgi:hypothetical protein
VNNTKLFEITIVEIGETEHALSIVFDNEVILYKGFVGNIENPR